MQLNLMLCTMQIHNNISSRTAIRTGSWLVIADKDFHIDSL